MSRKRALKREVSDGIRKVTLGAYRASRIEVDNTEDGRNRRYGTVITVVREDGGREPSSYPIAWATIWSTFCILGG
jgi:hypothetical protein